MGSPEGAGAEYLIVGTVRKPHGVRGEVFVWLETDHPEHVFRSGRLLLLGNADGVPTGGTLVVERFRPFKEGGLLKAKEHAVRTEALEALRGQTLLIPREEAAPLAENEVFYHQLPGMRVQSDGQEVGEVREVFEGAAADLLAVSRKGKRDLLIPFVREMVRRIDVEEGVLEMELPEGLLEL